MANTPTVYVICDQNCKFESMTKEQILTAITQAVNEGTISDINTGFVQTIKTINGKGLKFFVGEQSEYEALTAEDKQNLFAIITNDITKEALFTALEELQSKCASLENSLRTGSFVVEKATNAEIAKTLRVYEQGDLIIVRGLYLINACTSGNSTIHTLMLMIEDLERETTALGVHYAGSYGNGVRYNPTTRRIEKTDEAIDIINIIHMPLDLTFVGNELPDGWL